MQAESLDRVSQYACESLVHWPVTNIQAFQPGIHCPCDDVAMASVHDA